MLILFKYLVELTVKPSGPELFFVGRSLISNSISLVVIVLFKFIIST